MRSGQEYRELWIREIHEVWNRLQWWLQLLQQYSRGRRGWGFKKKNRIQTPVWPNFQWNINPFVIRRGDTSQIRHVQLQANLGEMLRRFLNISVMGREALYKIKLNPKYPTEKQEMGTETLISPSSCSLPIPEEPKYSQKQSKSQAALKKAK